MGIGAGLVLWKTNVADKEGADLNSMTEEEIQLIVADQSPKMLEEMRAESGKERRAKLLENLKQTLAFAAAAREYGLDKDPLIKAEVKNLKKEILAATYDYKTNVSKGPAPPLGYVTEQQIKEFWEGGSSWFERTFNSKESGFQSFIDTKIRLGKRQGVIPEDAAPKEDEMKMLRDRYARTMVVYEEAKAKIKEAKASDNEEEKKEWTRFEKKVNVQAKMQHINLLSRIYSKEVLAKKISVTQADIQKYLKENPELEDRENKKKKADEVLKKVLADGDFEALAKEYSDDPGSKNRGGLYEGVTEGRFAPQFEAAVAKLEPGEVADKVIETDFGYHVIKLIKRGMTKGNDGKAVNTYDVRHILIGTLITDPERPQARPVPAPIFVRNKLETERQEKLIAKIMKEQNIQIPEDFEVPPPSLMAQEREKALEKAREEQRKKMEEAAKNAEKGQGAKTTVKGTAVPRPGPPNTMTPAPPKQEAPKAESQPDGK